MKVMICGIPHNVVYCEDKFNTDTHFGQIDYGKAEITISTDISKEQRAETLCHEILHGMLVHIGRVELSQDEEFVACLSNAIYQTFNIKILDCPMCLDCPDNCPIEKDGDTE